MYWVMLTTPSGKYTYVNLGRFDLVYRNADDTITFIRSTLSQTEEDEVVVEVIERPDDFIPVREIE